MSGFSRPTQLLPGEGFGDFSCGNPIIDGWVRDHAASARKRGTAVVYVCRKQQAVVGFYTLSTHAVARSSVHGGWSSRNAPEEVPAVLLGMLGVDLRYQGMGVGASLLKDAIENALKVSELAGARALIVDPIDESAARFYARYGFAFLPGTTRMALRLKA